MFEIYLFVTGVIITITGLYAFSRSRDAMQPAVFMSPLFVYFYCIWPLLINRPGGLSDFFTYSELEYVGLLYLSCLSTFFLGMANWPRGVSKTQSHAALRDVELFSFSLTTEVRKRLYFLSVILGLIGVAAYWYSLENVGGFVDAYSRVKGGGRAYSGYIGEAPLLIYPAIALIALARQKLKIRLVDVLLVILLASPHLLQGTFGGRRGPLFLILAMLFMSWYIAKGKRPSLKKGILGVLLISIAVVTVWSQRQHLYIGSGQEFSTERIIERILPDEINAGDEYLAGAATVITAREIGNYYWGYRYFVTFFIRPIPRQIWPTKYEDMGADWLYRYGDEEREDRYLHAVGFTLLAGSSTGFVADVFYEFAWLSVLASFLLGKAFYVLWRNHRMRGGLATVFFLQAIILSIYLPTQSLTAYLHRFLFMSVLTWLLWNYWIGPATAKVAKQRKLHFSERQVVR